MHCFGGGGVDCTLVIHDAKATMGWVAFDKATFNKMKKSPRTKSVRLLPNVCDFQKENHTQIWIKKSVENL
jgi:hypothetical protein